MVRKASTDILYHHNGTSFQSKHLGFILIPCFRTPPQTYSIYNQAYGSYPMNLPHISFPSCPPHCLISFHPVLSCLDVWTVLLSGSLVLPFPLQFIL